MEMEGISVDPAALGTIGVELQQQIDELAKSIHRHADRSFNIASPKQLGEILFDHLGLADKAKKTKTGQYKTDEQTLATLEGKHPIISRHPCLARSHQTQVHLSRRAAKPHRRGNRPHPHPFPPTRRRHRPPRLLRSQPPEHPRPHPKPAARSARPSSRAIPLNSRTLNYQLLSCDYSQIELRVMAATRQRRHHDRSLPQRHRHPHHHRRQGVCASNRKTSPPTCAAPRRW